MAAFHPYRMRLPPTLALILLLVPCAPANPQASSPAVLPRVTAYTLDKVKATLPADFAAPLNLLILSFQRDQQPAVESWLPLSGSGAAPKVQVWLLPVSPRENGLYRWWLNASLRSSLPPTLPRRYTVPLYVNKPEFLRSLQVTSEQEVVLLLTDKGGHVLWRTAGPATADKKTALNDFLTKPAR